MKEIMHLGAVEGDGENVVRDGVLISAPENTTTNC
jgi:hypothetical protein